MRRSPQQRSGLRHGFTLVEMLVVLSLILVLAALGIAFIPRVTERQKTGRAADQLQGWLFIARQWAKRDGRPTGVRIQQGRIYPTPASPNLNYRTELQYIQQPPPYWLPQTTLTIGGSTATFSPTIDFSNGNQSNQSDWIVPQLGGDYLQVQRNNVYQIISVSQSTAGAGNPYDILNLAPTSSAGVTTTTDYKIFRAPRPLAGENTLPLPKDVVIDTSTNSTYGNSLPVNSTLNSIDILFLPSGGVMPTSGAVSDKIQLWVRDVVEDDNVKSSGTLSGEQTIVTIYIRTGFIAAHPVDATVQTQGTPVNPGANVQMMVVDATDITPGSYLILDPGTTVGETVLVTAVSGNVLMLAQVQNLHTAAGQPVVVSDPYSFTRDGRSSGM
jgi:prepilin-type N-terminal cleavage/methylation domain-containing protein